MDFFMHRTANEPIDKNGLQSKYGSFKSINTLPKMPVIFLIYKKAQLAEMQGKWWYNVLNYN